MAANALSVPPRRAGALLAAACAAALLVGCGGGDGGASSGAAACDLESQKSWLRDYMFDSYYWTGASPNPAPAGYASVSAYLDALRFAGDSVVPRDRWSYIQDSTSYSQFFGDGRTLGYGLQVNGIELVLPLRARYVEPGSPAAAAGIQRGDTIVSVNGRSAADLVAASDFAALSPAREGDTLVVVTSNGAGVRSVSLTAATYDLVPVSSTQLFALPNGRLAGYVFLKDFITQAEAPLASAIAQFRNAGATELIIDLRYNGGGRVSTAAVLASLVAGSARNGNVFTNLVFNARQAGSNSAYTLNAASPSPFTRAVVLTGPRTCSASELVVNGLKPFMTVVTVGAASCGKPFGFVPVASCGNTYSAVNFESFNALGQGRYYNGIAAACPVSDTFTGSLGDPTETLTQAATDYLQTGVCPVASGGARSQPSASATRQRAAVAEPGHRPGMWAD